MLYLNILHPEVVYASLKKMSAVKFYKQRVDCALIIGRLGDGSLGVKWFAVL